MDSLFKVIPKSLLPLEYGGDVGPIEDIISEWEKKILSYRQYYHEDEEQYGVDEKKRPGRRTDSDSLFGVEGTFRQLNFD